MDSRRRRGRILSLMVSVLLAAGSAGSVYADAEVAAPAYSGSYEDTVDAREDIIRQELQPGELQPEELQPGKPERPEEVPEEGLESTENLQPKEPGEEIPDSAADESSGGHHHDASCGYIEAQPEIPCDHECTDMDGDGIIDHCPKCAYRPETAGSPCLYELEQQREEERKKEEEQRQEEQQREEEQRQEEQQREEEQRQQEEQQQEEHQQEDGQRQQEEQQEGQEALGKEPEQPGIPDAGLENQETQNKEKEDGSQNKETGELREDIREPSEKLKEDIRETPEEPQEEEPLAEQPLTEPDAAEELQEETEQGKTREEVKTEETLPSNEPAYEVEIPSQVVLTEGTDSFDIHTRKLQGDEGGSLIVTVEGTMAADEEHFALYCEENSWEYRLQIGENILTPQQNKAILDTWSEVQKVKILPEENQKLCAGNYLGVLTFHVEYEDVQ